MGCGAVCGETTVLVSKTTKYSIQKLNALIPCLGKPSVLMDNNYFESFVKSMNDHPTRYSLPVTNKIVKNEHPSYLILEKWKVIILSLDLDYSIYCNCLGLSHTTSTLSNNDQPLQISYYSNLQQKQVYHHKSFEQIQKDLDRTFELPQSKRKQFQNILKRIANHFPKMGYTQGINFVVGYLIIIGYSEADSFWIFTHIALNKRYMLLGLYEDGFLLSNSYTIIFKNIISRKRKDLYNHMFQQLNFDPSMWVFKWFMTYYLYSFPLELCKYVWDFVIEVGGIGLVSFAVGLTIELAPLLLQINDISDISDFFQSLKDVDNFNRSVNLTNVMLEAYSLDILDSDFEGVQIVGGFYGSYLKASFKQIKNARHSLCAQSTQLLESWYLKLISERNEFDELNRTSGTLNETQIESNSPIKKSQNIEISNLEEDSNPQIITQNAEKDESVEKSLKFWTSTNFLGKGRYLRKKQKTDKVQDQINEIFDEEDSISAASKHKSKEALDELDRLQLEHSKKDQGKYKYEHESMCKIQKKGGLNQQFQGVPPPKRNNYSYGLQNKPSTFALAGQNILNQINYDSASVSSKNTISNRDEKFKENKMNRQFKNNRICGCKNKTEQNRLDSFEQNNSEREESIDKDSMYKFSQNEEANLDNLGIHEVQSHRERIPTYGDFMINSHGPNIQETIITNMTNDLNEEHFLGNEIVELHPAFKKNKKKETSGAMQMKGGENRSVKVNFQQNDEESVESINPISLDKLSQVNSHYSGRKGNQHKFEVQSVK